MRHLIIITGLSGSGKSIALRALEDCGYYCIDNLPCTLLPNIPEHLDVESYDLVAISIDSRSAGIHMLPTHIQSLKARDISTEVIYLEASVDVLVKRFSETRRKHPLSSDTKTLAESINIERDMLNDLSHIGHVIDTSHVSANKLRSWVKSFTTNTLTGITVLFTSFGFKHGIPLDADYIFDVRCLPNPHYDHDLRPYSGKDKPIQDFLKDQPLVVDMIKDITHFVEKWLPCFIDDNRSYFTVCIGCTGGQHRSVYIAEALSQHFKTTNKVLTRHRDMKE